MSAFSTFVKNVEKGEEKFKELAIVDQAKTLIQILKMFKCNAEMSDLTLIGGSSHSGKVLFNKKIDGVKFEIIHLSPAGLRVIKNKV